MKAQTRKLITFVAVGAAIALALQIAVYWMISRTVDRASEQVIEESANAVNNIPIDAAPLPQEQRQQQPTPPGN